MTNPFDQRTVSGLPWTRMQGTVNVSQNLAKLSALPPACSKPRAAWAICAALALAVCVFPSAATAMGQKHESRHEIDQLEDEWRDAVLSSNTKVMDSLLAVDYMGITASGTLQSRDETLQSLSSGKTHFAVLDI